MFSYGLCLAELVVGARSGNAFLCYGECDVRLLIAVGIFAISGLGPAPVLSSRPPVEVPLRMEAGRLIVPVQTGAGDVMEFVLSTGIVTTIVSETSAQRLGDAPELKMGTVSVKTDHLASLPDDQLTFGGKRFDGMVGPNTLNDFNILIDVPNGKLLLQPFGTSVAWEGVPLSEPVRLRVFHGAVLSLDLQLNGRPYGAMLDLGTPNVIVNERVQTETDLADVDTGAITVGGTSFSELPIQVLDLDIFDRWVPNGDGFVLLGSAILRECAMSLSWVHREMRMCVK